MDTTFAKIIEAARAAGRIRFGDVRRLQRALRLGIRTRAEAEALLALDHAVDHVDAEWPGFLVTAVVEFVRHDPDHAVWLAEALSQSRPKTAGAITREVDLSIAAAPGGPQRGAKPILLPARVSIGLEVEEPIQAFPVTWTWPAPLYGSNAVFWSA